MVGHPDSRTGSLIPGALHANLCGTPSWAATGHRRVAVVAPNHIDNMTLRVRGLRWHGRPRFATRCAGARPPSLELLTVAMLCLRRSATRYARRPGKSGESYRSALDLWLGEVLGIAGVPTHTEPPTRPPTSNGSWVV